MKMPLSGSSTLVSLALTFLLAALPVAIRRLARTGDPYLLTRQFFDDILARISGPGRLRFTLHPPAALLVGFRAERGADSPSGAFNQSNYRGWAQQSNGRLPGLNCKITVNPWARSLQVYGIMVYGSLTLLVDF